MNKKIEKYVEELLSQKVQVEDDFFSDKEEPNLNKENIALFIDFIESIYKDKEIAIFMFPFLEKIDEFIIEPENINMIRDMFTIMESQLYSSNFDIITSGSFGLWVYDLVERGIIDFDGNIVVVTGKIRKVKEDENNPIEIIKMRHKGISYKQFVFLDDSYFSGGTRDKINEFIKKYNSIIYRTFVFYTHNRENTEDIYSTYCYSDNHAEEVMPIHKYIEYIGSVNLSDYEDIIRDNIKSGQIKRLKDLLIMIKRLYDNEKMYKLKEKLIISYKNFINGKN